MSILTIRHAFERRRLALRTRMRQATCRHVYRLLYSRGVVRLRCDLCDHETPGYDVYRPLKGQR